jgi:non-ribosomal peptide synthetase component F
MMFRLMAQRHCLHQLFEAQVEKTPEAVAVVCQGKSLTYGELNQEAEKIAYRLRRSGVGPEVLVGLCVDRSVELVIGIVGILKAAARTCRSIRVILKSGLRSCSTTPSVSVSAHARPSDRLFTRSSGRRHPF